MAWSASEGFYSRLRGRWSGFRWKGRLRLGRIWSGVSVNLQSTASQAKRLSLIITTTQPQTNLALLLIVFLYPILWGIGLLRQRRHEHGSRKRWVLSCIPDYIAWIILILGIGYHLFFGENILNSVLENAMLLPFRVKKWYYNIKKQVLNLKINTV